MLNKKLFCIIFFLLFTLLDACGPIGFTNVAVAQVIPNDYYYQNQWYLQKIQAEKAWEIINKSPEIIIAIADSGVQINHPDLKNNIWQNIDEIPGNGIDDDKNGFIDDVNGWDFIDNIPNPSPKFKDEFNLEGISHGTIVAGIAAGIGNNSIGITGVTWKTKIMSLRVLNGIGEGGVSEVIRAIDYAIANGADIINFSFVGFGRSQALYDAIKRAYNAGIIIVAAAGNERENGIGGSLDNSPMYPVCYDRNNDENMIIGVAATDAMDQKTTFSNYGFRCVDISAPGESIFNTIVYEPTQQINNKYFNKYYDGYWYGTSMSAPMVSGTIALIKQINPKLNYNEIIDILLGSADNISRLNPQYLGQLGSGRLNVFNAVSKAWEKLKKQNIKLLITPHSDMSSLIKITDYNGKIEQEFFAYDQNFRGGVNVAVGDIDGDGIDEIITGAGFTGGPHVRVFNNKGEVLSQFFAYDQNFRGGVNVAVGDVDGDGIDEIITGAGFTGGPHIRIFDNTGKVQGQFFAYDQNFRGGINVAVGDVDNDGLVEIITGAGPGGTPHARVFEVNGMLIGSFYGYEEEFRGGIRVGTVRL